MFRILGPLEVEHAPTLGGPKPRTLLARLLLAPNRTVSYDELIDAVWPEDPPEGSRHVLQVYVSSLRRALGRDRIRAEPGGYAIQVAPDELDLIRFEELAAEGAERLRDGDAREADALLVEALALWRGAVLPEVGPALEPDRARLEEARLSVTEDQVEAGLELGRHSTLVSQLEALVRRHPTRERLRRQLMLALYRSGRQADALEAYRDARRVLVDELGLEPSAELRELEAAILRQDATLTVEPAVPRTLTLLPAPATPLIGRVQEVEEVVELFARGTRLVTLTGPGGVGKTRVAIQAAVEAADLFADGTSFVALAALQDEELVAAEIASALEVGDGQASRHALVQYLRDRSILLVLDNFEQLERAGPTVAELLGEAAGLKLLVTSRQRLRVYGEHEYRVEPLEVEDAVQLFLDRAVAAGSRLPTSTDVGELCLRLDCLPLAIELAAARTREFSLDELRATLPRLEAASEGPRDVPARQRTLRATTDWSYELLDAAEQRTFESLSVFVGGCTLADASAVARAEPAHVRELIASSLLRENAGRLSMLETIREYALAKLEESGQAQDLRRRHADHFLGAALEGEPVRRTPHELEWMDRLDADRENLRAALDTLLLVDPADAVRLAIGAFRFWYARCHFDEGAYAFARVLEQAELEPEKRAQLLGYNAAFEYASRELTRARVLAEESVELGRALGNDDQLARSLVMLGTILVEAEARDQAVALLEEAVESSRRTGDDVLLGFTLSNLANGLLAAQDLARLEAVGAETLELSRRTGDIAIERSTLTNLGLGALLAGDAAVGATRLATALEQARDLRDPMGRVECLEGIAAAAALAGDAIAAARILGAAETLRDESALALEKSSRLVHERAVGAVEAILAKESLRRHWRDGAASGADAMLDEALAVASFVSGAPVSGYN